MKTTANSNTQKLAVPPLDGFKKQPAHAFGDAFTIQPRRRHEGPPAGMTERRHVMYSGRTDHKRLAEKREKEAAALALQAAQAAPAAPVPQVPAPQAAPAAQAGELLALALVRALAESFGPTLARALAATQAQAAPAAPALVPPPVPPAAPAPKAAKPAPAPNEWPAPAAQVGRAPARAAKPATNAEAFAAADNAAAQARAQAAQVARGPERRTDAATADAIGHTPPKAAKPAPAAPYVPPPELLAAFEKASKAEQAARITPAAAAPQARAPKPAATRAQAQGTRQQLPYEAAIIADETPELADLQVIAEKGDLETLRRAAHAQAATMGAPMDPAERRAMRKSFAELDARLNSEEFDDPATWAQAIDWKGSGHSTKYRKIFEWALLKELSAADAHNIAAIKSYGLQKAKLV